MRSRAITTIAVGALLLGAGGCGGNSKSGSALTRTVTVAPSTQNTVPSTQNTAPSSDTGRVPIGIGKGILVAEQEFTWACQGRSGLDLSGAIELLARVYQKYPEATEFRGSATTVRIVIDQQVTFLRTCRPDLAKQLGEAIDKATGSTQSVAPGATGRVPETIVEGLLSARAVLLAACEHKEGSAANVQSAMKLLEHAYQSYPNAAEGPGTTLTVRNRVERDEAFLQGCRPDLAKQLARIIQ